MSLQYLLKHRESKKFPVLTKMKVKKLKKQLKIKRIDAMFVSNPQNIQYLSGIQCMVYNLVQKITDPEAFLVITKTSNFVLADPRHAGTVQNIPGFKFVPLPYPTNTSNLASLIDELVGGKNVGFEEGSFLYSELKALKKKLGTKSVNASRIIETLREVKDETELKLLKKAAKLTSAGFEYALSALRQGMTEKELANEITSFFQKEADGNSFNPIVAFGKGSAIPHYEASDKKIEGEGILLIDLGCKYRGYCGDMTRTVYIGKAPERFKEIYSAVLKAQKNCLKNVQAGMSGINADLLARDNFSANLKDYFSHGTGHGLGLAVHEAPKLTTANSDALVDGMVFTVEPGIYIPNWGGIRIEDVVYLNNGKPLNITKTPKKLMEIKL